MEDIPRYFNPLLGGGGRGEGERPRSPRVSGGRGEQAGVSAFQTHTRAESPLLVALCLRHACWPPGAHPGSQSPAAAGASSSCAGGWGRGLGPLLRAATHPPAVAPDVPLPGHLVPRFLSARALQDEPHGSCLSQRWFCISAPSSASISFPASSCFCPCLSAPVSQPLSPAQIYTFCF